MLSNILKMIKIEWNVLKLRQIVRNTYNFNISTFVGYVVWIVY